jgi:polyisoprenoid-binding protein YceI
MRNHLALTTPILVALLAYSCANPAANKPKATVSEAVPEVRPQVMPPAAEVRGLGPENSKVEFVAAKVTRSHNGAFKDFTGSLLLENSSPENSRVTIDIQMNSVVTDEPDLTKHLQTPDFFDVAKYPKATFTSTKIEPAGGSNYNVTGNLDLHGVKKSIKFPATITVAPDSVSVSAEFSINRQDFKLVYPGKADDLIRDGVLIKLTIKVPRKP